MKFDKETAIVVLVCIVLITLCHIFLSPDKEKAQPAQQKNVQTAPAKQTAVQPVAVQPAPEQVKETPKEAAKEAASAKIEPYSQKFASLENDTAVFHFDSRGILKEVLAKNVKRTKSGEPILFKSFSGNEPFSCDIDGWKFTGGKVIEKSASGIVVNHTYEKNEGKVTVRKVFTVSKETPALQCSISFSGNVQKLDKVTVWSGTIAPLKYFSNDDLRDIHQAEYMLAADGDVETADPSKKLEKYLAQGTDQPVKWVAVSNKFFLSQLYAEKPFNGGTALANHRENNYLEPGIAGVYRDVTLPSEYKLTLYSGSKAMADIGKLPEDAQEAIHLAYWSWFEFLCRPMLALLNWLKNLSGSYGLAIILLTIIVKLVLWPLIHKSNKSMRKMQKIQPKLKELKEKYKDNAQMFNQKMMELYREEKVNPMGGCLPMLLQFPIFIALYSTLEAAVELRNVPFLWAKDLSQPDAIGPEIWGFSLHPLILISTGLMILQMKLSPQTGDPMQRKMMMIMPLIMLIFFYSFPSGLALYWTVNNILSIMQMKYSQYTARKEEEHEASAGNGSAKTV